MRITVFVIILALSANSVKADEIDNLVTNLADCWDNGAHTIIHLPKTASAEDVLRKVLQVEWVGDTRITNYTVLKIRQVNIPRARFKHAYTDPYTAALVQTSHGEKIALFRYWDFTSGWSDRILSYPEDISGPVIGGDQILNWLNYPARRDPHLHIAFVEVESITNEYHAYEEETNSRVSDDGGKTWYNIVNVWSATATIKIIESPGVDLPTNMEVNFQRFGYVHSRGQPWTDWLVKPGARLLCFFSDRNGKWSLEGSFLDPFAYLLMPDFADDLQALFKTPLASKQELADRKQIYDDASERARKQAAANHNDGK